mmetsp:Transcript_20/g.45  ORF Transcript_20/g.45 Transcript_20/m.45 type:complete len:103 (-) Transcript_20:308-616(-)
MPMKELETPRMRLSTWVAKTALTHRKLLSTPPKSDENIREGNSRNQRNHRCIALLALSPAFPSFVNPRETKRNGKSKILDKASLHATRKLRGRDNILNRREM